MRLTYLTVATVPFTTAHSKYVVMLCHGFAKRVKTTIVSARKMGFHGIAPKKNFLLLNFPVIHTKKLQLKSFQVFFWHGLYVLWRKVFGIRGEDVFIVHNGLTAILCALFRCLYIIDLHGKEIGSNISRRIVGKYPPVFWIVQSILLKDYLINDINVLESKILLSRNAVNYIFDTKEIDGLTLNREQHSIAYIGRLMPQMGYGILLNALNEYTKPRCVKVVMAGDHSRHTEYFDRISKGYPKASQQVVFTGFINEHEIEWLSRNVNAFLLLYSSEFYLIGALSPMKLFEYLKYNKPIIAPNIKDIFEVVEYYGCEDRMIWYEMDDAASLGRAFVKLVDDPPVRIKAVQIETWDNKAEQIVEFLIKNKNKVRGLES